LDVELIQEIDELRQLVTGPGLALVRKLLSSRVFPTLLSFSNPDVLPSMILPVQPVLRDCWHDHVLFCGDTVTGIIDYGAMQIDNVAFDIARLLGTTVADDQELWDQSVADYCELRQLSEMERKLLPWIDQTGVFIGSCHWIHWLMIEKRTFRDWSLVKRRVRFHRQKMQRLIERG
jgi:Ser/Thr protein kinase RdoA (MazF antagonist)